MGSLTVLLFAQLAILTSGAGIGRSTNNSDITLIQIKPVVQSKEGISSLQPNYRSSRIENLLITPVESGGASITDISRTSRSSDKNTTSVEEVSPHKNIDNESSEESEARFDLSEAITPYPTDVEDFNVDTTSLQPSTTPTKKSHINKLYALKPKYSKKYNYGRLDHYDASYRNYIETRRFRSRCRCERIWNCPKLQLSVPRCPEEFFMCCF